VLACEHRVQVIDFSKQIAGAGMKCTSVLGQLHAARRPVRGPGPSHPIVKVEALTEVVDFRRRFAVWVVFAGIVLAGASGF
jgi:hypothetical protein